MTEKRPWSCVEVPDWIITEGNLKCIGDRGGAKGGARGGRHILIHSNDKAMAEFREAVSWRYISAKGNGRAITVAEGPIEASYRFLLQRPASVPAKKRRWPWKRGSGDSGGDLDKLERSINDALTGWAWADDSQICRVLKSEKRYATPDEEVGMTVWWRPLVDEENSFAD